MNLFRTLRGAALLGLAGSGLAGCIQAPEYPTTPEIDFKEVQVTYINDPNSPSNELAFVLNFRDGDGDLGLSKDDINVAPYNQAAQPVAAQRGHTNNQANYYIQPYVKDPVTGRFTQLIIPFAKLGEYDSTFPRLDGTDAKPAPLKGELKYRLPLTLDGAIFKAGQVLRFELTILDRQLHVSNTVTTSEITLGPQ